MTDDPTQFVGSIPQFYDQGLGPIIFADYADIVAQRVAAYAPRRVLETAAGTGIVSRRLRDLLPAASHLTATDLNPPMLDTARAKFRAHEGVTFQPADATELPFPDQSFDALVCQFGVMFFPDKNKAYRDARRVLAPGGRYFFSVWDSHDHNLFGRLVTDVLRQTFAMDPPSFMAVPFGYHALDPIRASLGDAGFGDLRIDIVRRIKTIVDYDKFASGLVLGSPVVDQIRSRGVDPEGLTTAVADTLRRALAPSDKLAIQAILFEARRD